MGFLDRLFGNDHERADTRYADRESASDRASRRRHESHRRGGATRAARAGQDWEAEDRARDRRGTWYSPKRKG